MHRLTPALLCSLAAVVAWAAPAPTPRPWVTGWAKPVNPSGKCRFDRKGDTLTLTLPGRKRFHLGGGPAAPHLLPPPRLMRDLKGDFLAEVRVSASFKPTPETDSLEAWQGAGLFIEDRKNRVLFGRFAVCSDGKVTPSIRLIAHTPRAYLGEDADKDCGDRVYLRLERMGDLLLAAYNEDGARWTLLEPVEVKLSQGVKVGVAALASGATPFRPCFDRFGLSRPTK